MGAGTRGIPSTHRPSGEDANQNHCFFPKGAAAPGPRLEKNAKPPQQLQTITAGDAPLARGVWGVCNRLHG